MSWLGLWKYRRKITISNTNIDSTLSNFPVYINISSSSGTGSDDLTDIFDELTADANRKKIAITTSDGETQCYVEIERWDDAGEKAELWVKVPSVSDSAETELYIYFDSAQADNTTYVGDTTDAVTHNVWDANFMAVWHMAQDPNGDPADGMKDSTSNQKDGTPEGTMVTADLVNGKIGKAIDFDGDDDAIDLGAIGVADPLRLNGSDVTIEAIINHVSGGDLYQRIIDKSDGGSAANGYALHLNGLKLAIAVDGNYHYTNDDVISYSTDHYVVGVITGSAFTEYVDGASKAGGFQSGSASQPPDDTTNAKIATWNHDVAREFKGVIDEIRISNTARSAAWIKATYYSHWDGLVDFSATEEFLTLTEAANTTLAVESDIVISIPTIEALINLSVSADVFAGDWIDLTAPAEIVTSIDTDVKISVPSTVINTNLSISVVPTIAVPTCIMPIICAADAETNIFSINYANKVYIFTLTGTEDGVSDIEIPISSFQSRLQNNGITYLSVVIPGIDYLSAINARLNGELVLKMGYKDGDTILISEIIAQAFLENLRYDEGATNEAIILDGHGWVRME